jgi:hypothetical protein
MPTQPLTLMSALQGSYIVNDTNTWTGTCDAVYVLEDTVFNVLTDSEGLVKGNYIAATATAVKAGALIRPLADAQFVSIDLTSGSVALIL